MRVRKNAVKGAFAFSVNRPRGLIYFDTSNRGEGRKRSCWRAEITLAGVRLRRRSHSKAELRRWLAAVRRFFRTDRDLSEVPGLHAAALLLKREKARLLRL